MKSLSSSLGLLRRLLSQRLGCLLVSTAIGAAIAPAVQAQEFHYERSPFWQEIKTNLLLTKWLHNLKFINPTTGFCTDSANTLYRTLDAGRTWQQIHLPVATRWWGIDIVGIREHELFVALEPEHSNTSCLYLSKDNGDTWQLQSTRIKDSSFFQSTHWTMWNVTDGAQSWVDSKTKTIRLAVTHDGWKTTEERGDDTLRLHTLLNGEFWPDSYTPNIFWADSLHATFNAFDLYNKDTTYLVYTNDGGRSWHQQLRYAQKQSRRWLEDYTTANTFTKTVFAKEYSNSSLTSQLLYSLNSGNTWQQQEIGTYATLLAPVGKSSTWAFFPDHRSELPTLGYTNDLGKTWQMDSVTMKGLTMQAMHFLDEHRGWVIATSNTPEPHEVLLQFNDTKR